MNKELEDIFDENIEVFDTEFFKNQWELYKENYKIIEDLLENDEKRALRMFNFRFRIALDIKNDFKGIYSKTKTPKVKQAYIELFDLLQLWNSYESLIKYRSYSENKEKFYYLDNIEFLKKSGSYEILNLGAEAIKKAYNKKEYKKDFDQYHNRLMKRVRHPDHIKYFCEYLQEDKKLSVLEVLNLIYCERNLSYHEGEAVRMGCSYRHRIHLIKVYKKSIDLSYFKNYKLFV